MKVRVQSGSSRAQEIFMFFEEAFGQRSCESWGGRDDRREDQSAEWIRVRWWRDILARRKRSRFSMRRRGGAEELRQSGLER